MYAGPAHTCDLLFGIAHTVKAVLPFTPRPTHETATTVSLTLFLRVRLYAAPTPDNVAVTVKLPQHGRRRNRLNNRGISLRKKRQLPLFARYLRVNFAYLQFDRIHTVG